MKYAEEKQTNITWWKLGGGGGGGSFKYMSMGIFRHYSYTFQLCHYMIKYVFQHQII